MSFTTKRRKRHKISESEALETRALLATFTVTSLDDSVEDDGETTLREAITMAADSADSENEVVFVRR